VYSKGPAEQTMLHLRIDELERRLAQLEEQIRQTRAEADPAPVAPRDGAEILFGRRSTDPQIDVSEGEGSDAGREGARLVALEMLSAGYRPEQIATYLRETFGVDDPDQVVADAGPMAG
jgi:uncharacterized small protein (DUF1192 family)